MYLMFKGKGCWACPFLHDNESPYRKVYRCKLDIKIEDPTVKPNTCPFKDGLQTVEIDAEESE